MALTTAIPSESVSEQIKNHYNSNIGFADKTQTVRRCFAEFILMEDEKYIKNNIEREQYECQKALLLDISKYISSGRSNDKSVPDNLSSLLGEKLVGIVERYDEEKKYGFIKIDGVGNDIYFNTEKLEVFDMEFIADSDIVYCTMGSGPKGYTIKSIDGLTEKGNNLKTYNCKVKVYFDKKHFGFCYIEGSSNEAFFHLGAFPRNFIDNVKPGLEFVAEVRSKDDGKYQVRRCLSIK